MSASAQRSLTDPPAAEGVRMTGGAQAATGAAMKLAPTASTAPETKLNVFVAADNRLLREALAHMLMKKGEVVVTGFDATAPWQSENVARTKADVVLLTSRGALNDDLLMIQRVRVAAPGVRILLLGTARSESEFLQCVRAGIHGYLLHDASSDEVLDGVRAVHAGQAVCPAALCTALFRYFENQAAALLPVSAPRSMGLTRREQQLIPLIARGLTNKEIANHFSLSEQTVKNHLYRMKQKTGAEGRLDIVQVYRVQGFLV
jgi:DNA-binding NarL/FixJ family response regulator